MKRPKEVLFIFFLAIISNYICIPSVGAESYHFGATLICSDCHTSHYSYQHGFTGGAPPGLGTGGPFGDLLRYQEAELCLSCHDGVSGVPDVMGTDINGGAERAAGHFETIGSSWKGHNLSTDPGSLCTRCHFGGEMATASVTCTDCHNPHGVQVPGASDPNYRNLHWPADPVNTAEIRAYVNPGATGPDKYQRANVAYPAPTSTTSPWREVTNICLDCHHVFSGPLYTDPDGDNIHVRHPVTDSERGAWLPVNNDSGANTDPAHWEAGDTPDFTIGRVPFVVAGATDFTGASTVAQDNEVFCFSCHKAHGSDYSFGTRWNYGGGDPGDKTAGCNQCHNK
jgi:hypothetical protein